MKVKQGDLLVCTCEDCDVELSVKKACNSKSCGVECDLEVSCHGEQMRIKKK